MLFYQVGELFQSYAVGRSRQSISQLMEIRPDYANLERDGKAEKVDPDEVNVGDVILVKPGERVPLDGVVLEGRSTLDTAALTGESLPRDVGEGDDVISGCVNQSGLLRVRGDEGVWRIDRFQNSRSGGERRQQEGARGELHHQVRPRVHALRGHCRGAAGCGALARQRRLE